MLTALLWCLFVPVIVQELRNKSALHQQSSVTIGFKHLSGTQKPDGCFFYAHIHKNEIYESRNLIFLLHGIYLSRGLLSTQKYTICIFCIIEESPNGKAWAFDAHICKSDSCLPTLFSERIQGATSAAKRIGRRYTLSRVPQVKHDRCAISVRSSDGRAIDF